MVNTPVLFETFVRVDYARQVWDAIKAAQPKKLYFYSNKGRAEKEGEIERNNEIRSWVKEIDWDCELHTWFREECVDVYTSLRGAISWLFDNEDTGIVLEDDCVPTMSFFSFVDQLLPHYQDEELIWGISGTNFYDFNPLGFDVIYSHTHYLYGWATWANRWKRINWEEVNVRKFVDSHVCYDLYKTRKQARWEENDWLRLEPFIMKTKCWDYVWDLTIDGHKGLIVYPSHHLVTNIGVIGTHQTNSKKTGINRDAIEFGSSYRVNSFPPSIQADFEYDYMMWKKMKHHPLYKKIINKIKRFLRVV